MFSRRRAHRGRRTWPCVSDGDFRVRNAQALASSLTYRKFVASRRRRLWPTRARRKKKAPARPRLRRLARSRGMSAARRPPDDPPDDPREDVPVTHAKGGRCAMAWCCNYRWVHDYVAVIDGYTVQQHRLRRFCRPCARVLDAAIVAAGGGSVSRLEDYR